MTAYNDIAAAAPYIELPRFADGEAVLSQKWSIGYAIARHINEAFMGNQNISAAELRGALVTIGAMCVNGVAWCDTQIPLEKEVSADDDKTPCA